MTGQLRQEFARRAEVTGAPPSKCQFISVSQGAILAHIRQHRTTDGLFCGAPSLAGKPYCAEHSGRCFVRSVHAS